MADAATERSTQQPAERLPDRVHQTTEKSRLYKLLRELSLLRELRQMCKLGQLSKLRQMRELSLLNVNAGHWVHDTERQHASKLADAAANRTAQETADRAERLPDRTRQVAQKRLWPKLGLLCELSLHQVGVRHRVG